MDTTTAICTAIVGFLGGGLLVAVGGAFTVWGRLVAVCTTVDRIASNDLPHLQRAIEEGLEKIAVLETQTLNHARRLKDLEETE